MTRVSGQKNAFRSPQTKSKSRCDVVKKCCLFTHSWSIVFIFMHCIGLDPKYCCPHSISMACPGRLGVSLIGLPLSGGQLSWSVPRCCQSTPCSHQQLLENGGTLYRLGATMEYQTTLVHTMCFHGIVGLCMMCPWATEQNISTLFFRRASI